MTSKKKGRRKGALATFGALAISVIGAAPCRAIDYQPFDWVPLPPGTSVVMGYYEFGTYNAYNSTIAGTVSNNTHLESNIGIARYLHYSKDGLYGHPWDFNFLVPFGSLSGGKIDGNPLGSASGVGDPIVSAGFWFINQPEHKRWFSAASYLTLPIGTYDKSKPLNLGGNRWQQDLQADFTQGFLDKYTVDVSGDWIYYWDNDQAGPDGHQTLSQNSSYGAWVWLTRDVTAQARSLVPTAPAATISIGYAGSFGGVQKLDGARTGGKTQEQQLRLSYMQFITPEWQGLLSLSHDTAVSGQFKQSFGLLFRVAKLF